MLRVISRFEVMHIVPSVAGACSGVALSRIALNALNIGLGSRGGIFLQLGCAVGGVALQLQLPYAIKWLKARDVVLISLFFNAIGIAAFAAHEDKVSTNAGSHGVMINLMHLILDIMVSRMHDDRNRLTARDILPLSLISKVFFIASIASMAERIFIRSKNRGHIFDYLVVFSALHLHWIVIQIIRTLAEGIKFKTPDEVRELVQEIHSDILCANCYLFEMSVEAALAFIDELGSRQDITDLHSAFVLRSLIKNRDFVCPNEDDKVPLSKTTLDKLIASKDPSVFRFLLGFFKNRPEHQKSILSQVSLGKDYIQHDEDKHLIYPELHEETIQLLLKSPTAWDLVICAKQGMVSSELWDAVDLQQLMDVVHSIYWSSCLWSERGQRACFDGLPVKEILNGLSGQKRKEFLNCAVKRNEDWVLYAYDFFEQNNTDVSVISSKIIEQAQSGALFYHGGFAYFLEKQINTNQEFLPGCTRTALFSFLCIKLPESAMKRIEAEILKRDHAPPLEELQKASSQLWGKDEQLHRGEEVPVSLIRWLADGDINVLQYLLGRMAGRQMKLSGEIELLEVSTHEQALCWLTQASQQPPFPVVPDCIKRAVHLFPGAYGNLMGSWDHDRFDDQEISQLVLPKIKKLGLQGDALEKFGAAFVSHFNPFSHKMLMYSEPSSKAKLDSMIEYMRNKDDYPRGNVLINVLSSTLVYESDQYSDTMNGVEIDAQDQFNALLPELIQMILSHLNPHDLMYVAFTCKALFNKIATRAGTKYWKALNLGSLDAVRHLFKLSRSGDKPKPKDLRQALYLASPDSLVAFDKNADENSIILRSCRNNPSNSDEIVQIKDDLVKWGLPRHAIKPFCKWVKEHQDIADLFIPVLQRIRSDHPYFDLESELPAELNARL